MFTELESALDESAKALAEALAGAAEQREADLAAMSEAVSDAYRILGSGDVPSGSSPQSRLQALGDHARCRVREALHERADAVKRDGAREEEEDVKSTTDRLSSVFDWIAEHVPIGSKDSKDNKEREREKEARKEEKRKSDAEKMGHNISKNSKSVYTLVALVVPCKTPGVPWETPGYLGRCSGCHARSPGSHARHSGQCRVHPGSSKGQGAPWKGIRFLHSGCRALEWYTGQGRSLR